MTERRLRVEVVEGRSEYGHPAHWIGVGGGTSTQDRVAALRMLAEIIEEFDARRILTCIWEEHGTIKTEAGTGGADENAATLEVLRTVARRWHGRLI